MHSGKFGLIRILWKFYKVDFERPVDKKKQCSVPVPIWENYQNQDQLQNVREEAIFARILEKTDMTLLVKNAKPLHISATMKIKAPSGSTCGQVVCDEQW